MADLYFHPDEEGESLAREPASRAVAEIRWASESSDERIRKAHKRQTFARYRFSHEIHEEIRLLNRSDNWHSLLFLSFDVFWIAVAVAVCLFVSWWLYPLAALIIGARQRALGTIFHDCVHGTATASKRLEIVLGTVLTAYPIFQLYSAYKGSHVLSHHPGLGDPNRDPDLQYFLRQNIYQRMPRRQCFVQIVILPLLGARTISFHLQLQGVGPEALVGLAFERSGRFK